MIEVTHFYGVHQGGTKDYHLYLFYSKKEGSSILVKRWGKKGSDGQVKVELAHGTGNAALNSALKEREGKGYDMRSEEGGTFPDVATALKNLPRQHQRAISNSQLSTLDPVNYRSTDRSPFDPLSGQREDMRSQMERETKDKDARLLAEENSASEEVLKSNPMFGMF